MKLEQLYEFLDIEHGGQFEYFENFADLVETPETIDDDTLFALMRELEDELFCDNLAGGAEHVDFERNDAVESVLRDARDAAFFEVLA